MGKRGRRSGDPRRQSQRRGRTAQRNAEVPGNVARAFERWERLQPALDSPRDLPVEIARREAELTALLEPFHAVHILGHMVMQEVPSDPDTYVESEHEGAAHVLEVVAAVLARRSSPEGTSDVMPPIEAHTLEPAHELPSEMVLLEGVRRNTGARTSADARYAPMLGRAAMQHLYVRGPGWAWQEADLLRELFGPQTISDRLTDALGFDAADGVACAEAVPLLIRRQMADYQQRAMDGGVDDALAWAEQALGGTWREQPPAVRDRAITALWAMNHLGEGMLIDADALAEEARVQPAQAEAFLRSLVTPFGQEGDLFEIVERLRAGPYLDLGDGRFFSTVPGSDIWALRFLFENAVKRDQGYLRHRGRWVEGRAKSVLGSNLTPDETYQSVRIVSADDHGREFGEIDVLARFGDTVLTVEAKGATIKPGARRGGRSLIDHLRRNLTKAAEQGSLALRALTDPDTFHLLTEDRQRLDLGEPVREVHPIVVTLDDYSAVAPVLWELVGTDVLPETVTVPWVVTLHEMELVTRLVEWPVQLIHFLRRRARLNQLGRKIASDELDWWMLYLKTSLYFEEEPLDGPTQRFLSQTDALDAWALYDRGLRSEPAAKPRQDLERPTEEILATLSKERPPGWVAAGCSLLDVSGDSRDGLHKDLNQARKRAAKRNKVQRGTLGYEEGIDPLLICWLVAPDGEGPQLANHLETYLAEMIDQLGIRRVVGIAITSSSARSYDAVAVLERTKWSLPGR